MADVDEYRCFVGSLSWNTTDRDLKEVFEKYGPLVEAKVVLDKFSGRSCGFGFVAFDDKRDMEEAIKAMHGMDLDGRTITVERAQPNQGSSRDRDGDRDRGRNRDNYGGGSRGGGGGDCFKCGKPGHFARECPSGDGGRNGGKYGGRDDRKGGGGGGGSRYGSERGGDRYGGGSGGDRYGGGGGGDRYGGGGGGGKYRESGSRGGSGSDRYGRDRAGPY